MNTINKETLLKLVHQLKDVNDAVNSVLVLQAKATNTDYTYKIKAFNHDKTNKRIILIKIEVDYNKFKTAYLIGNGECKDMKYSSIAYKGANWFLNQLYAENIDYILTHYNVLHTGRCIKCNRTLTDATSIKIGMGSKCRSQ